MPENSDRVAECASRLSLAQPTSQSRISAHVRSTHDADGAVVLDIIHGQMFRLNYPGSKILELVKQGMEPPEIAEQMAREFGIGLATAETDVYEFVETLKQHHLVIS
jgi:hypothetical protein